MKQDQYRHRPDKNDLSRGFVEEALRQFRLHLRHNSRNGTRAALAMMATGMGARNSTARTHAFFSTKYQYTSERKGAREIRIQPVRKIMWSCS
jgi:hypothetical protein